MTLPRLLRNPSPSSSLKKLGNQVEHRHSGFICYMVRIVSVVWFKMQQRVCCCFALRGVPGDRQRALYRCCCYVEECRGGSSVVDPIHGCPRYPVPRKRKRSSRTVAAGEGAGTLVFYQPRAVHCMMPTRIVLALSPATFSRVHRHEWSNSQHSQVVAKSTQIVAIAGAQAQATRRPILRDQACGMASLAVTKEVIYGTE